MPFTVRRDGIPPNVTVSVPTRSSVTVTWSGSDPSTGPWYYVPGTECSGQAGSGVAAYDVQYQLTNARNTFHARRNALWAMVKRARAGAKARHAAHRGGIASTS